MPHLLLAEFPALPASQLPQFWGLLVLLVVPLLMVGIMAVRRLRGRGLLPEEPVES